LDFDFDDWGRVDIFLTGIFAGCHLRAGDRVSTFSALSSATSLCLSRPGALLAIATWFGAGHLFVAVIA